MDNAQFKKELAQSRKIEALFRKHPKFPFLNTMTGKNFDEHVLLSFFWLYIVKPYTSAFGDEKWRNWLQHSQYESFRKPDDFTNVSGSCLNFYGDNSRRWLQVFPIAFMEDNRGHYDLFQVNSGTDEWLAEVNENSSDTLYFLAMGVDLRHPESLDKAREFMHAFFIEKLPLEEMEQKIERFERDEGHKFKRGASFEPVKGGSGDYSSIASLASLPKPTASVGAPCPTTGMWYCEGVSPESGVYMRKGDPMPGQSYSKEQQETMEWRLIKPLGNT